MKQLHLQRLNIRFLLALLVVGLLQSAMLQRINAQTKVTPDGIIVNVNGKQVELAVAKTQAFRLSVSSSGTPKVIPSIFIDNSAETQAKFTVVSKPPVYGIKTSYGKLEINSSSKTWSLYDANGKVLISNGTFVSTDTLQSFSHNTISKSVLYGAGNYSTKNLVKNKSVALQGNGTVDIPYLWSSAGYSILGITNNDNRPATWSSNGTSSVDWKFKGRSADLYLWLAQTLYDATKGLVKLSGKPKLPPKWAYGYLQSQWGWQDRAYIEDALNKFRTHKLPVDAFIYDFEWYTVTPDYFVKENGKAGYSDFSFNAKLFPEPEKQIADYKSQGVKFIGIRKPRLGDSLRLVMARSKGWVVKSDYNNRDIDFSNADLRKWYAEQNKPLLDAGVDAWWDDEGEAYYSCYYWWNKAQYDLRASVRPNDRHFSINRSFSLGTQRLGFCTWNGDIKSTWEALQETPADLLNWSLSGMYYGSCDIGGFQGTPSKENLVRWFQAGVFFPVMRAHSNIGTVARFPWLWEADGEAAIRKALNLRYQLLPFIYSLGHEAYKTGAPIMRPLVMEFQNDSTVANMNNEWLLGKGLLAAPVLNEGGTRSIYLPKDRWYEFETGKVIEGPSKFKVTKALDEIPVYVRAGTILPVGPLVQYSAQDTVAPLEIRIYPGHDGKFVMTEDDGKSYNYTKGSVRTTTYIWADATKTLKWQVSGTYSDKSVFKTIKVVLEGKEKTVPLSTKGSVAF
ncbi:MAG: glycoside hydrolase family 31 protein [Bacteroidota bacterium]|nr:glycoside hydrolase family 31 protein [Bacteroidota bacterium]